MRCTDCGTLLSGNICPNCHEELFIFENQYEYLPNKLSDDFSNKIKEQREKIKRSKQ